MGRHHMTSDGPIAFTSEEEAEWDAKEAAYAPESEPSLPTKEHLMAELAALTAKIQALP